MARSLYPTRAPDFLATIHILPLAESVRKHNIRNGIRLALAYPDDFAAKNFKISDVWPDFLGMDGNSVDPPVDLIGSYKAEMYIIFPEMVEVHYNRLTRNPFFFCTEGRGVLAKGRMDKFLSL